MIVYSVTVNIHRDIEKDWVGWMRHLHIPDVMDTGHFTEFHFTRMIDPPSVDPEYATYNIQYLCENVGVLKRYMDNDAPGLQEEHTQRYRGQFTAFRTILKRI